MKKAVVWDVAPCTLVISTFVLEVLTPSIVRAVTPLIPPIMDAPEMVKECSTSIVATPTILKSVCHVT